ITVKKGDAIAASNCVRVPVAGGTQLIVGKDRPFTFDMIHDADTEQAHLYDGSVAALVDKFMEGYNATVLAYGQTGSGKTHTMSGGAAYSSKIEASHGVIPRTVCHVFRCMQQKKHVTEFLLRVEYLEIYNEELRDLLHPETPSKQLSIREDANGNILVSGAQSRAVQTPDDVMRLLSMGTAARVTGSTNMNEQSSRSHAIFSLMLQQRDLGTGDYTSAKFHLVDLAGSERAKRTGAVGGRFKESININQGLLALGNVISALGDESKKRQHVPYRDSKLTRLLQDSLGGNSKTLMIACVSPAAVNFEESLNTLKYANRAKNIKNRPVVNHIIENEHATEIERMKTEIQGLQSQLQAQTTTAIKIESDEKWREKLAAEQNKSKSYKRLLREAKFSASEAATTLVGLEREIKVLGRPIQQRLNEVVKTLNGIMVLTPPQNSSKGEIDTDQAHAEIMALKEKLKQDVEIFNHKAKDMENLQSLMLKMKAEFDTTVLMNQQLTAANAALEQRLNSLRVDSNHASPERLLRAKQSPDRLFRSSKSLFRQRHQPNEEDDCVLTDDSTDNNQETRPKTMDFASNARQLNEKQLRSPPKTAEAAFVFTDVNNLRTLFKTQLQSALNAKEVSDQLQSLVHDKEETERQIHDIALRKTGLEMERMRQSLSVKSSISDLSTAIQSMSQKMPSDPEEVVRLKRRKERAEKKLTLLIERNESQEYLEPGAQEELAAIEEQIEDLNSQILFQDAQLESAKSSCPAKVASLDTILKSLGVLSSIDGKLLSWLQLSWSELVNLAYSERQLNIKIQQQDDLISQLTQTRTQLENGLVAARAEFDRLFLLKEACYENDKHTIEELTLLVAEKQNTIDRLTKRGDDKTITDLSHLLHEKQIELDAVKKTLSELEKDKQRLIEYDNYIAKRQSEWEDHMNLLKNQLQAAKEALHRQEADPEVATLKKQYQAQQEYINNLEKHVVLFKTKAKQTQLQLQQLIRDSSNQNERPDDSRRIQQLEEMNEALAKENAAMKVHVRAIRNNDEPHVCIRVPKTELMEVEVPNKPSLS
ncbi:kinesin, partial [Thraustotheca clavata]